MKPSIAKGEACLARVRGIVEGTRPTGRKLCAIPLQERRAAPAQAVVPWAKTRTVLDELASLNLAAKYSPTAAASIVNPQS